LRHTGVPSEDETVKRASRYSQGFETYILPGGVGMRYERPMIVRRERITGLGITKSDGDTTNPSDIARKEHIVPVTWDEPRDRLQYETPSIDQRERIQGLLRVTSDGDTDNDGISDIARKEHIVPVAW
jgi:hypothetical protein